jgi:hypothetical protein
MSQDEQGSDAGREQADTEVDRAIEANRLYWGSEAGVNQIADDLGLSKGSLYEIVQPLPSELPCPRCGTEMAYPNRTAREKGFVTCPACQLEEEEDEVREALIRGDVSRPPHARPGAPSSTLLDRGADPRVLAGTALLGVAVGIVLGSLIRK